MSSSTPRGASGATQSPMNGSRQSREDSPEVPELELGEPSSRAPARSRGGRRRLPRNVPLQPSSSAIPETYDYCSNLVRTSRYTAWNFVPLNLFEQLREMSNFYFLCIGIMQAIPAISASNGIPTMYIPLSFILFVSGLRAAVEDYHRHETDKKEGSRVYHIYDGVEGGSLALRKVTSADLRVGEIVQIKANQSIPADILMLRSSTARGHCFVETSNLDGETDLKPKVAVAETHRALLADPDALGTLKGELSCESPNKRLEVFTGYLILEGGEEAVPLSAENLLLRGTVLKNTDYVVGMIVYTGEDTKIRRNVKRGKERLLKSTIMQTVDGCMLGMLALQFFLCFLAAIVAGEQHRASDDLFYLQLDGSAALEGFLRFFTWFIILSQLVPISLLVSSEIVKTFQAFFINRDVKMYDPDTDTPALVRSSVINEDLGQVQFIFSDKTGTLTQNKMEFRVGLVGVRRYGSGETEISKRVKQRMNELAKLNAMGSKLATPLAPRRPWTELVEELEQSKMEKGEDAVVAFDSRDQYLDELWLGNEPEPLSPTTADPNADVPAPHLSPDEHQCQLRLYLTHMAISNTITPIIDPETGLAFQSSSPDELALCKFAQYMGFELVGRNPTRLRITKFGRGEDEEETYRNLAVFAFNSKRKRVTIIYQRDNKILIMTKGADSNVLPLLAEEPPSSVNGSLMEMALNGLRTLVTAHAERDASWWHEWKSKFEFASSLPEDGDEAGHQKGNCQANCRICSTLSEIEENAGLRYLGATAIEDRLQELVPEAIEDFLKADIKVWMLTGDKRETAKNIALACNLIDPDMENLADWTQSRLLEVTGQWSYLLEERSELYALFKSIDANRDGTIDADELLQFFNDVHMPLTHSHSNREEVMRLFRAADSDGDNAIDFENFVALMRGTNLSMLEAVASDIKQGLMVTKRFEPSSEPVSMVVEGAAFAQLYPPGSDDSQDKKKPKKKRLWKLMQKIRRKKKKKKGKKGGTDAASPRSPSAVAPSASPAISPAPFDGDEGDEGDVEMIEVAREPQVMSVAEIEKLRDDFFELASRCKSVVCCRMTPYQKAKICQETKRRQNVVTLAIGDGANDEAMIKEADVGVGISGLEGTAAARASSYSVGKFRFLHTLLFVHGHWSYRRIAKLVPYIFYKAILPVMCMFWFGFFSHFSGQQLLNPFVYTFYNVIFTAAPVMVLAVLDQGLSRETCENNPRAYKALLGASYFNPAIFSMWIGRSIFHSIILYFFAHAAVGMQDVGHDDGLVHGIWVLSTVVYTSVVILATFRICLEFATITVIHQFFVWLSFFGFFLVLWIVTLFESFNLDMFGVVERMYATPAAWLCIIISVALPILIDFAYEAAIREFRPTLAMVLQERQRMTPEEIANLPEPDIAPSEVLQQKRLVRRYSLFDPSKLLAVQLSSPSRSSLHVKNVDSDDEDDEELEHAALNVKTVDPVREHLAVEDPTRQQSQFSTQRVDVVMAHMLRFHNMKGSDFSQNPRASQYLDLDEMEQFRDDADGADSEP